jgi:hypothetical protein
VKLHTTTALLLALATGSLVGCGSEDEGSPIPADAASSLQSQLDSIEARFGVGGGACTDITGGADPNEPAVQSVIDSLPQDVDPDVRQALQDGFDRLFTLTDEQCEATTEQETEPEPEPLPTETEELPTETEELPTETEPLPTETDEEPPLEEVPPEVPPGQDGENPGQGGGTGSPEDEG